MAKWNKVALVACVFVLWLIIFGNVIHGEAPIFFGSVAATVLTVFLYTKIVRAS